MKKKSLKKNLFCIPGASSVGSCKSWSHVSCHNLPTQPYISHESAVMCHFPVSRTSIWKNWVSLQTVLAASRADVSVKSWNNASQRKHQPSSLFLAVTTGSLTSAWLREQRWREMTRCAVWREMPFMDYSTANGVIIYDHCILLFLSRLLPCLNCTTDEEETIFHYIIYI